MDFFFPRVCVHNDAGGAAVHASAPPSARGKSDRPDVLHTSSAARRSDMSTGLASREVTARAAEAKAKAEETDRLNATLVKATGGKRCRRSFLI